MKAAALFALLLLTAILVVLSPAHAACGTDEVSIGTDGNAFTGGGQSTQQGCDVPASTSDGSTEPNGPAELLTGPFSEDVCILGGNQLCQEVRLCADGTVMQHIWYETVAGISVNSSYVCPADGNPAAQPDPGPSSADILRAFRRIPLPESVLIIQPPGGATLVNFDTNFYTEAAPFDRTVRLLGHRVTFRISTQSFTWHFGDHTSTTTTDPGAAYPALDVTHRYLQKGTVAPSVDTTWEADYQLDDRPWAPVNGTVTIHGPAQQLTIKSATPILVG